MFRASGPFELRPVGETEFLNGVAAMFVSGKDGETLGCAGEGGFIPVASMPEAFTAMMMKDIPKWAALLKDIPK